MTTSSEQPPDRPPEPIEPKPADYAPVPGFGPRPPDGSERLAKTSLFWAVIGWASLVLALVSLEPLPFPTSFRANLDWLGAGFLMWPVCNLVALVTGWRALAEMGKAPVRSRQRGKAIAGTALGLGCFVLWGAGVGALGLLSLQDPKMHAKRSICAANLIQIGQAMQKYAARYGEFPSSFDSLVKGGLNASTFLCPCSSLEPEDLEDDPHRCYACVPVQGRKLTPKDVLVYEFDHHAGEGGNVLFGDFHVEWIEPYSKVLERVRQTAQRLGLSCSPATAPASRPARPAARGSMSGPNRSRRS
jgi:prepilin-type processing-associated H-X9-DG protein